MGRWNIYAKNGGSIRCSVNKIEYNGEWMGACNITTTITNPTPIYFELGDYIEYRGERFEINYDPTVIKSSSDNTHGEGFKYDNVVFNSLSDELVRCNFLDYVLNDNKIHYSSLPNFSFYASNVRDLANNIQANLDRVYKDDKAWAVIVHDEFKGKTNINVSVNSINCWEALALAKTLFDANFIIRDREIIIGTEGIAVDKIFSYGKGNGLITVERNTNSDQQIITRLRAYGSTRNMPLRYYYNNEEGAPNNLSVQNLMLPTFPTDPDPYIDSSNINELGVREGTVFFDGSNELPEIYPTMEGMTADILEQAGVLVNASGRLDVLVQADQIEDDGVEVDGMPSTFKVQLKDIGFDLNDYGSATMSMKNGMCGGRDFKVINCKKDGNGYTLECERTKDDSLDLYFPNKNYNLRAGDEFVFLDIEMPEVYIKVASQRLLNEAQSYLSKNCYVKYTYTPEIDNIFLAKQHEESVKLGGKSIYMTIKEGDMFLFEDESLGFDERIIISNLNIVEDDKYDIPQYKVVLSNEKSVGAFDKIQDQIKAIASAGGNSDQLRSLIKTYGSTIFLRKDQDDRSKGKVASDRGFEVGNYINGMIGGQGGKFYKDENGKVVLELDKIQAREELLVPKLTYNCIDVVSGEQASSFAYGSILSVDRETMTASLNLLSDEYGTLHENDLCRGIFHFLENENNTEYTLDQNKFHNYSGYTTSYFKVEEILESTIGNMTFRYSLQEGTSVHPCPSMNFYAFGNTDDVDRQSITYRTREYERRLVKMKDWVIKPSVNIAMQNGKLDGLVISGVELRGYGTYQDNCYFTGTTFQLSKEQQDELKGDTIFKSTTFRRYNGIPTKPTGGTFEDPIPDDVDDNGVKLWSDGIPSGEEILWASTRIFSSDESQTENTQWSEPAQMTDTSSFDVEFSNLEKPSAPTGHPNTNTDWSNIANEGTIWMATSTKENGVWSDWSVIKIKGEKGDKGDGFTYDDLTPQEKEELKGENAEYYTIEAAVATIGFSMTGSYSPSSFVVSEYSINGSSKKSSNDNYIHIWGCKGDVKTHLYQTGKVQNHVFDANSQIAYDYDYFLFELRNTSSQTSTLITSTTVSVARRGDNGTGIKSVTITYGKSTDKDTQPTSWSPTIPTLNDGEFLWTKTTTDYTDDSVQDTDSFSITKQGKNGTSVTVKETKYQAGTSATQPPSGEWKNLSQVTVEQGQYLWTRIIFSDNSTIYNVAKQGVNGKDGEDGTTIVSIKYQEGTSPVNPPTGTWSNDVVDVAQGNYLWTKTTYSDGKEAYGVARQGMDSTVAGPTGAMARYRGQFIKNNTAEPYIYDKTYRDIVIYGGNAYQVRAFGMSVTAEPTGSTDKNWEIANPFSFVAMDTALVDSANIAGFVFQRLNSALEDKPIGKLYSQNGTLELNAYDGSFKCENVDVRGVINATSGSIGGLKISENSIGTNSDSNAKVMTIMGDSIEFKFSTNDFIRFNAKASDALFYGRADEKTLVKLNTYGSNATALDILCNGSGVGRAINSIGENFFVSRYSSLVASGEQTMIAGLSLSCKNGTLFQGPSNISNTSAWVDFLVATGNITLPPANNYPGKIIFVKFQGNYKVSSSSNIVDPASTSTATEKTRESKAVFYISNGANWYEFYCG